MNYGTLLFLLEKAAKEENEAWYLKIIKKIGEEIADLFKDFADFFSLIKKNTFDVLVDKFGETGVMLAFLTIVIIIFMVIVTGVIRGRD